MNDYHKPVLLKEVLEYLHPKAGCKYIDATLGGGGHAIEILERGGEVLGIDCDKEALDYVKFKIQSEKLKIQLGKDLILAKGNFKDVDMIAYKNNFKKVSGILMDLGVSSKQLDDPARGFSFLKEGPLDMRMDKDLSVTAKDLIEALTRKELYKIFIEFGEEKNAWRISGAIKEALKKNSIKTTKDLVGIIDKFNFLKISGKHGSTRVFQALRIAVNGELEAVSEALPKCLELLENSGRLLVISFHSLEDRIVKNKFSEFEGNHFGKIITARPVIAGELEVSVNNRARSAKLRVFEKN